MNGRTTKALLVAIALGVWVNVAAQFLTAFAVGAVENDVSLLDEWLIRGAPVTVTGSSSASPSR